MSRRHSIEKLLPVRDLTPEEFEILCEWLLQAEGFTSISRLGGGSSQYGVDLLAKHEGEKVIVQCKRVESFHPSDASKEVAKLRGLLADEKPDRYILASTAELSIKTHRAVKAGVAEGTDCRFWGPSTLDRKLRKHADLLERFFSGPVGTRPRLREEFPVPWRIERLSPNNFINRPEYAAAVAALVETATSEKPLGTTAFHALRGAGGFGKTTLARQLAHDEDVRAAYPSGVFWLEFGAEASDAIRVEAVRKVYAALTDADAPHFATPEDAGDALGALVLSSDLRFLLILDDVWSTKDYRPLSGLAPIITLLITTRLRSALPRGTHVIVVDKMTEGVAIAMLGRGLPQTAEGSVRALTTALGGWALLLEIVNRHVLEMVEDDEDCSAVLKLVRERLRRDGITTLDPEDPEARNHAVALSIDYSLDRIPAAVDRERVFMLAIFPENVEIPIRHAATVWGLDDTKARLLCERLRNLSILQVFRPTAATLGLHSVVRDYLKERLGTAAGPAHRRLLDAHRPQSGAWSDLPVVKDYLWQQLGHHLNQGAPAELETTLEDAKYLQAKLAYSGVLGLVSDFRDIPAQHQLRSVRRALEAARHILVRAPQQLFPQLLGRVPKNYATTSFRNACVGAAAGFSLLPVHPTIGWTQTDGSLVSSLDAHSGKVLCLAMLSDGRVVSGSSDHTLAVWDMDRGESMAILHGHTGTVAGIAVLPDDRVGSASHDATLRVWDPTSGECLRILVGHTGPVTSIAALPDGRLVSGSQDDTLRIWNSNSGDLLRTLRGFRGGVRDLAIRQGPVIVSADGRGLQVWDPDSGGLIQSHKSSFINALATLPDGRVAYGGHLGGPGIWDPDSRGNRSNNRWVTDVYSVCAIDNQRLLSGLKNGYVRVWDTFLEKELAPLVGHNSGVRAVVAGPGGSIVSGSDKGTLRVWRYRPDSNVRRDRGYNQALLALAFRDDGAIVSGSLDHSVGIWDPETGQRIGTLEGHDSPVLAVAEIARGLVASAGLNGTVRVWDVSGEETRAFSAHKAGFMDGGGARVLSLSDGRMLTFGSDGTIRIWEPQRDEPVWSLDSQGPGFFIGAVVAEDLIALGDYRGNVAIWDLQSGKLVRTLQGHTETVRALAALGEGLVASGSKDSTIRIWDARSGELVNLLKGHKGEIRALAALPDSQVISGATDGTLRVWRAHGNGPLTVLDLDARAIAIATREDGLIAAGDGFGQLHLLRLHSGTSG